MDIESIISLVDFALDSRRKRHVVGGILLSVSFLFAGLALTAMTSMNSEEDEDE